MYVCSEKLLNCVMCLYFLLLYKMHSITPLKGCHFVLSVIFSRSSLSSDVGTVSSHFPLLSHKQDCIVSRNNSFPLIDYII